MDSPNTLAFIGGGNMTTALVLGLQREPTPPSVVIAEPSDLRREQLAALFPNARVVADNREAVRHADVVILAVKPQVLPDVARDLRSALAHQPLIISIAAGITTSRLAEWLGENQPIVRAMPNTPALVGSAATGLFATPRVDASGRDLAERVLRSVGLVTWLEDESLLDAVTALSGSGPAYVFLLMEAMEAAGEQLGLKPADARLLCLQTVFGAAKLALESEDSPARLREKVTSPGGTTQAAIEVLERANFRELMEHAMQAAANRARKLGRDET